MTTLDQLPSEIISLILDHIEDSDLPACSLINRSFYNEATPLVWRNLRIWSNEAHDQLIDFLSTSPNAPGHHVRCVRLGNCGSSLNDTSLLAWIQHVPYLEELEISIAQNISDVSFQHVPRYCPRLKVVDLHCDTLPAKGKDGPLFTDVSIKALGRYCHQLMYLNLFWFTSLDYADHALFDPLRQCPLLTHISIRPPPEFSLVTGISRQFAENAVRAFSHEIHRHQLTSIILQGGGCGHGKFIDISNKNDITWPNLTTFSIYAPDLDVTDDMAIEFIKRHPTIKCLHIEGSNYLTDDYLDGVTQFLPRLTELRVECNPKLTASGISRLIRFYDGQLETSVMCEGCGIFEDDDDLPEDIDYGFLWQDTDSKDVFYFSPILKKEEQG